MSNNEEVEYYTNCSGAKKRKKKIKKKEKVDVFLMREKVKELLSSQVKELKNDLNAKLKKIINCKIPYGINKDDIMTIVKQYNLEVEESNKEITYYDIKTELNAIREIEEKLDKIPMEMYIFDTMSEKILERTRELLNTPVKINFFNKKQNENTNEKELDNLKQKMIELCKPFMDFSEQSKNNEECECGNKDFIEDMSHMICTSCGKTSIITEVMSSSFQDNERVSYSQKYKYKKINHFKDTIRQFQGIQNKHIDPKVLDDLKTALEKDKIIDYSLENSYSKLTKEHLRIYLDHTGHNKYYEDINLIYQHFTGKKCPSINQTVYNKLLEDFEKLVQMFINISENEDKIERTNFLNSQYVLYQLLKRNNYHCCENDFALPRSTKCRVDQEKIFIMLCEKLHWSYISIL
jgi:hypothetical protein